VNTRETHGDGKRQIESHYPTQAKTGLEWGTQPSFGIERTAGPSATLGVCNFIGFAKNSMLKIKSLRASKIAKNQKSHNLSGRQVRGQYSRMIRGLRRELYDEREANGPHHPRHNNEGKSNPKLCHPEETTCLRQVKGEMTLQKSRWMRGPEGRSSNFVSPARKGWGSNPGEDLPAPACRGSAVGAALNLGPLAPVSLGA
jgi:hypothetical protein